ncbi:uncharacterized protein LOC131432893 [Malaya genurostris]|uniref:uncharacterized protein LOC131432893 n=1 Tax=Malaya genurostris TaxID=325434 RepID=UPI0026F38C71|nr:uncharacterized protein LOC131432893 [Malaya genurostris]
MVQHWLLLLATVASLGTGKVAHRSLPGDTTVGTLFRAKRFLLFPINAQLLFTVAGTKGLIFKGPGGYFVLAELDLYHPLPDYRYRISSLRLGETAMLPEEVSKTGPVMVSNPSSPTPLPLEMQTELHHDEPELSSIEIQQYLKDHPETWIPAGYEQDQSDWSPYNPSRYDRPTHLPVGYEFPEVNDPFNTSRHRDWEHFYHYRERRELYHSLETEIGERFDFPMKSCILRAICEVRKYFLPPGKSMIMDIIQIVFRIPLHEELQDEYSSAMREESRDCHKLYGKKCPISIVYLILFGKFVR